MSRKWSRWLLVAFPVAALGAAGVAFSGAPTQSRVHAEKSDLHRQLDLFYETLQQVRAAYVDKPDDKRLIQGAIKGMVAALDPHSGYMTAQEVSAMREQLSGKLGGLGVEITMQDGAIRVVAAMDDTPAARSGLLANDVISGIDGAPVGDLSIDEVVAKLRGPIGTRVTVTITRRGTTPFDVTMERAMIDLKPVSARAEGDVAYIRISNFIEDTHSKLEEALGNLKTSIGPQLKGIIIDLRNDPGGLLDEALSVSDDFLESGVIFVMKERGEDVQRVTAEPGDIGEGKPIVVLINGGSASASEIVAGALQDNKRATIVGTRSFGKGSVQSVIDLGGNRGALRLTTARYFTPSGRSIQAKGIEPDVVVEEVVPPDQQASLSPLKAPNEASLRGHLKNPGASDGEAGLASSSAYVPKDPEKDTQLQYALQFLRASHETSVARDAGQSKVR